jgi:large subunit ribosomal protein L24
VHVKKGDFVTVMSGRDKGKTGRVLRVLPRAAAAVVEKVGVLKRHSRPTPKNPQGGVVSIERPLPASSLMVVCMSCRRPTRPKRKVLASGDKVRICRHCSESLDKS